jgi:hypothetical protein
LFKFRHFYKGFQPHNTFVNINGSFGQFFSFYIQCFHGICQFDDIQFKQGNACQIKMAADREMKESSVDIMITAEASWVSLFNWAQRT